MSEDFKKRVQAALNKVAERDLKEIAKLNGTYKKRTHTKPEKEVEKECIEWWVKKGWVMRIYESKATYSPQAGRWINQSMKAGHFDSGGTIPGGTSAYVEFKAKGRLSTFAVEKNHRQQEFAKEQIEIGAFVCVTDSAKHLEAVFEVWDSKRKRSLEEAKAFLFCQLPKKTANP